MTWVWVNDDYLVDEFSQNLLDSRGGCDVPGSLGVSL